jgi:UDP-GlcNAc:undecaprenyl-phosphate/decaprenyl-phosphate GlcNAc-1-phosphate transferase
MADDAVYAFFTAAVVSFALTPLTGRLARMIGAVDEPRERGLSDAPTPRLGGVAILAGTLVAAALWLPTSDEVRGIFGGAALVTLVGAIDDVVDLPPFVKLAGQFAAALVPVLSGVFVSNITVPFIGAIEFSDTAGEIVTLIGLVVVMNVVNLSDGVDGLAAGVCTIAALTFAIIAYDLGREGASVLAALTAGASLGFLFHNFHPASVFMGDSGSNLLGLLLGCTIVQGSLKTNAVIALVAPLIILAVPFLDTGFVVAKRVKYRRPIYRGDSEHFHHRLDRIGFSQRRTVLYLYAWTLIMGGLALALRFVPYSDDAGHFNLGWVLVMVALGLIALAASVYLVYVLEILKFKRLRQRQMRRADPDTSEWEIDERVAHDIETGEFEVIDPDRPSPPRADSGGTDEIPVVR